MTELNADDNFKSIINGLSNFDLTVHNLALDADYASDIYRNYKEYTGNIISPMPSDEYYVMNQDGDVGFIGNYLLLGHFIRKLNNKDK